MTNTGMFFRMLLSAVFRRRSRAVMAVVASLVGAATLSCLAMICIAVPQQMNQEMRAYGANLIVTPLADSENGKSGIDDAMVEHTTEMVSAKGSEKHATYRYENVRVNAANLEYVFEKLFGFGHGQGYPKERVVPEQRNKKILDGVRSVAFRDLCDILKDLDRDLVKGAFAGEHFAEHFFADCKDEKIAATVKELMA